MTEIHYELDPEPSSNGGGGQRRARRRKTGARKKKIQKAFTPSYAMNLAIWYLERYSSSVHNLRQVMMKRVPAAMAAHEQTREECVQIIEATITELVRLDTVSDERYATATIDRMQRQGAARRKIETYLRGKGVDSYTISSLLKREEDEPDPDRVAAIRYAKRRRFGAWRKPGSPPDKKNKELASMARTGFAFSLSRSILEEPDVDVLLEELYSAGVL